MHFPDEAYQEIRNLVSDLAAERYDEALHQGRSILIAPEQIKACLRDHRETLIDLPSGADRDIDIFQIGDDRNNFDVDVPLWTREKGRSTLTLALTVFLVEGRITLMIDDLFDQLG